MRAIAIGWQGALLGTLLVAAMFFYWNSPFAWGIIAILTAMQGLLSIWVLVRDRTPASNDAADDATGIATNI